MASREPSRTAGGVVRTDYAVTNALGTTLATFGSIDLARAYVRRHIETFPSIRVEEITLSVTRKVVYRPARPAFHKQERAA